MSDRNVCSNSINGNKNETFNFKNENSNPVIVKQDGTNTWPFTTGPNLNVPAKVGSTAGTLPVTLIGTPGTYHYCTSGCPDDPRLVNPKTVIIG
jgi:hypothetical protein